MQPSTRSILQAMTPSHDPDQQPLQKEAPSGFNRKPASWRRQASPELLPDSTRPEISDDELDDMKGL